MAISTREKNKAERRSGGVKGAPGRREGEKRRLVLHQARIYLTRQITPIWLPLRKPINKFIEKYNSFCVVSFKDIGLYSGRFYPQELTPSSVWIQVQVLQRQEAWHTLYLSHRSLFCKDFSFVYTILVLKATLHKIKISHVNQLSESTELSSLCAEVHPGCWLSWKWQFCYGLVMTKSCKTIVNDAKGTTGCIFLHDANKM